jgi:hypothetical protein
MPSDIATLEPRTPDRSRLRFQWWWLPLAVGLVFIIATIPRLFANPATVDRVNFVNHTEYAMDVEVTGAGHDGWTAAGIAERQRTTSLQDVVDQGKTWIFRFTSQGVSGGELRLTKEDLAHADWKVDIPDSVGTRLAREGATPTPPPDY